MKSPQSFDFSDSISH